MKKKYMRFLSTLLTLVIFLSISPVGYAWGGGIGIGGDWDREIGEDEVRDFDVDVDETAPEEYDYFSTFDQESGINVTVEAPMGALPLLAEVRVEPVDPEAVREAVDSVTGGEREILLAMDISFWLEDDEIEPEEPVRVKIAAPELEGKENLTVVHIPDNEEPETLDLIPEEELSFQLGTNEIAFSSGSFSVYAVVEDPVIVPESRVTVNFINPHLEGENKIVATVYVKNSDDDEALEQIVYDPGIGEVLPAGSNLMFRGWSINRADANPDDGNPDTPNVYGPDYDSNTKVYTVEEIRDYLKGIEITEGDVVEIYAMIFKKATIKYIGYNEDLSMGTFAVLRALNEESAPYTVSMAFTPGAEQNFEGWMIYDANQIDNIVSATYHGTEIPKPFSPAGSENPTVFPNDTILQVKGDVTLSVSTPSGHWLVFDENGHGATYNAPLFIKGGKTTSCPELAKPENMKRVGYTFGGWYKDAACTAGQEFSFGGELEANTTIYAKWTQVTTAPYTVIIWTKNLNGETWDYVESIQFTGNVGDEVDTVIQRNSGDNAYARVNGVNKQYPGFHLSTFDDPVEIVPEGNAIVNVYYERTSYTLTFQDYTYTQNRNGEYVYWPGGYYRSGTYNSTYSYYPEGYYSRSNNNNTDEGDYGVGPSPVSGVGNNATVTYYTRNANGTFTSHTYTAHRYNRSNNRTTVYTITAAYEENIVDHFPIVGTNGMTYDDGQRWEPTNSTTFTKVILTWETMPAENVIFYMNPGTKRPLKTMNYYVEALPGTTSGTVTYNGKTFVLYNTITARYNMVTEAEDFFDISGFEQWASNPAFINGVALNDSSSDGTINMYYLRKEYPILYMDGKYVDGDGNPINEANRGKLGESDLILYNANMASYNKGGANYFEPEFAGYAFAGWYLDAACTAPCTFTTMPQGGITVYGKWVQVQFRVFLHPNVPESDTSLNWGSETVEMTKLVDNGDKISLPNDGKRNDFEFVGWFTDPEFDNVFNADVVALTHGNVTTPYDKTVDMTKPMNKYGLGATENEDLELFWVTTKLDLYGKWKAKIEGAPGVTVIYDVGEGSGEINDPNYYEDNTKAVAQGACLPPEVAEGERALQFLYWIVQRWDGTAFVDELKDGKPLSVYPGDNFLVLLTNAREETIANPTDPNVTKTYTIQLRAVYGPVDAPTPTYITWYSNVYDLNGQELADVENLMTHPEITEGDDTIGFTEGRGYFITSTDVQINAAIPIPAPQTFSYPGYRFLGWGRVDVQQTDDGEASEPGRGPSGITDPADLNDENLFLKWVEDDEGGHYEAKDPNARAEEVWVPVTAVAADEDNPYQDLYAVWAAEFYVYHSGVADGALETVLLTRANGTYDLTQHLGGAGLSRAGETPTVLYGGYYVAKEGGFTPPAAVDGVIPAYDGTNWTWVDGETQNGMEMHPQAGVTYYIKEVPADKYLQPYFHYTYKKIDSNPIVTAWLISDIDDETYRETGFVIETADGKATVCSSLTVTAQSSGNTVKLTPKRVFGSTGLTGGFLTYRRVIEEYAGLDGFGDGATIKQYWVTPDGLIVTGTTSRVYSGTATKDGIGCEPTAVVSTIAKFETESLPVPPADAQN